MKYLKAITGLLLFVLFCGFGPIPTGSGTGGGGGGATPGGSTNSVQYNAGGGNFGGTLLGDAQLLIGQTSAAPLAETLSGAGDCGTATLSDTGVLTTTCLKSNGNLFTSATFGSALNLTAPGAIGSGTPSTGAFTTLSASSTVSGSGFSTYLASPPTIGGTAPGLGTFSNINQVNNLGTIASAGTATCDFSKAICLFTTASSSASITIANPTNLPTNQMVYIVWVQASTGFPAITWGNKWYDWSSSSRAYATPPATNAIFTNASTGIAVVPFWTDGTNLFAQHGPTQLSVDQVNAFTLGTGSASISNVGTALFASTRIGTGDNTVASMARLPLTFNEGPDTALAANESLGTYKTVKAITIENIELDVKTSPTCSVSEQITCYDCGTSAGACTAGQTATIMSAITIASGATRQSSDQTINTANVAAGHYISCLITAGTCTVSNNAITMMARPQ